MKKRFAVAIDSMTPEFDAKLHEYVKANGFGWWHWIDNFWLLTTRDQNITSFTIRDALNEIIPNNKIVIEVSGATGWAGYGPNTENNNMFSWVHETWSKD